jgi:hypothetical protein
MENVGLSMLALALIGVGIMSAMSIDFSKQIKTRPKSVFHY